MAAELPYTVACSTPGCNWEQECYVHDEARVAGDQHEEAHDGHLTYVRREQTDMRAAPWHAASTEELARQFIAADIERGLTFAHLAVTENTQSDRRSHLALYAAKMHAGAERQLDEAEACGWDVRDLRPGLCRLREAVAELGQDERKAA